MARITRELTNIQNDVAGKTAQIICPVTRTYDQIVLEFTGTAVTRAMLKDIKVKANGETIQKFKDGDQLDQYNDYYNRSDVAGFLTLWAQRPEMVELSDQRITGWGTQDLTNLVTEIDIAGTAPADFDLKAHAVLSEPQPLGLFTRVKTVNFNSSVAGQVDVDKIQVGPRIMAIHAFKADVSDLEIFLDEVKIYDASKAVGEVVQKNFGRVPQTAVATHADFTLEGDIAQALVTQAADNNRRVRDLLLKPTLTTAGAVDFVVEYLDGLRKAA